MDKISVVEPDQTESLAVEEGKDLVTLFTCTPYGVNSQRLLVRGHRVPYEETEMEETPTSLLTGVSMHTSYLFWVIVGLTVTAAFVIFLYIREKKLRAKLNAKEEQENEELTDK